MTTKSSAATLPRAYGAQDLETLPEFLEAAGVTLANRFALLRSGEDLAIEDADAPCGDLSTHAFLHLLCTRPLAASPCRFVPPAPPPGSQHTYKWWAVPAGTYRTDQVGKCVRTRGASRLLPQGAVRARGPSPSSSTTTSRRASA